MPQAPDLSGAALDDRYELHALIGEGAFGRVYQGRDRRLARPVAVKVIKPWWAEDPEWVATFEREAQLLARVSDPGIVQIYDVGQASEGLYYVSELVDGENLARRLRRGSVHAWEACDIAAQLCRALAHAHSQRIVHRDIKPANILISTHGRVKVGDFGVARLAESTTDGAAGTLVGTPKYMAPEQGRGLPTTPATDVYSVGVVLYEMLAGQAPFVEDSAVALAVRHLQDPPPPLPADVPDALVEIVGRALAKDPNERYADGGQMADALVEARRRAAGRRRTPASRTAVTANAPAANVPPANAPAALVGAGGPPATAVTALAPGAGGPTPELEPERARMPPRRPGGPDRTRYQPRPSPRHNVNPSARRRAIGAFGLVLVLLGAMIAGAVFLHGPAHTQTPSLTGLRSAAAATRARRHHLVPVLRHRYDAAPAGDVISQSPGRGVSVPKGSKVSLVISRGPAPVQVPLLAGESSGNAQASLGHYGLRSSVVDIPAPGKAPGTVIRTSPSAFATAPAHSTVTLYEAETPQWRPVTSFTGQSSVPFSIQGTRWRIVYRMGFEGTCTWIFFCSGPSAHVVDAGTGSSVAAFGLDDGGTKTRTFSTGPGTYEVHVTPGGDTAQWSLEVEDYY